MTTPMLRTALSAFLLSSLGTALVAQEKATVSPNRFVPKDARFVMRLDAPQMWRQKFAETKLVALFASESMTPIFGDMQKGFREGMEAAKQEGNVPPELLESLWSDYTGQFVFAARFDTKAMYEAGQGDGPPNMQMIISMAGDGKLDLNTLAETSAKMAEEEQTDLADVKIGDHHFRLNSDGEMAATLPQILDGHLVALFGTNLETEGQALLNPTDRSETVVDSSSLSLNMDLRWLQEAMTLGAQQAMDGNAMPFEPEDLFRVLGLGCLESMSVKLGADGKHVFLETNLITNDQEQGLFGALMSNQGEPKLTRFLPPNTEGFSAHALDLSVLRSTAEKFWTLLGDEVPMTFADMEQNFAEQTKVRLHEDLLAHVGTEMMTIGDARAMFDAIADSAANQEQPDPNQILSGYCFVLALKNGKAFGESLDKLIRSAGLHAGRKSEDYRGTKVSTLKVAGLLSIEYAVTDEMLLFVLGKGDAGRQLLRGALDARADGSTVMPESLAAKLASLPEGRSAVGLVPMAGLLRSFAKLGAAVNAAQGNSEDGEKAVQLFDLTSAELQRLGIGEMAFASYTGKKGLRTRYIW